MSLEYRTQCPECAKRGNDRSGDNLAVYEDGSFCHACRYTEGKGDKKKGEQKTMSKEVKHSITQEEKDKVKKNTTSDVTYRGIRPETNKYFGIRYMLDGSKQVLHQYCPTTEKSEHSGYKKRTHPKQFATAFGLTGKQCDLFGQFRFPNGGKYCLIVGGEIDQASAYQMLRDNQIKRGYGEHDPYCVVSPTVGEGGSESQIAGQYKFFDQFERIILAFDNDDAGKAAMDKVIKVLPKGKVYIASWRYKDPNSYIWDNVKNEPKHLEEQFIKDFWNHKKYVPAGIIKSSDLMSGLLEHAVIEKIPLPPFFKELQKELAGGIPLGYIVNIIAASGIGKTSVVNELLYYWIFNSPHFVGILSTELEAGQYSEVVLSRHLGKKLALFENPVEKVAYLNRPEIQEKALELFQKENGDERWVMVDDRGGDVDSLKDTIEEMIITCGCKVVVIDVLHDVIEGLDNEAQGDFMKWQKGIIKTHGITFVNINHTRKKGTSEQQGSEGGWITEEDIMGSSTIYKSAGANILLMRNKNAEDNVEKNTTTVVLGKCRWSGNTGLAGEIFYDNKTHTLYDKKDWMDKQGLEVF